MYIYLYIYNIKGPNVASKAVYNYLIDSIYKVSFLFFIHKYAIWFHFFFFISLNVTKLIYLRTPIISCGHIQ